MSVPPPPPPRWRAGALKATDLSPGYYSEGALHNGAGVPAPCCSLTLDSPTGNHQGDEWRCHAATSEPLLASQWADDGRLAFDAAGAPDVHGHPSAFLPVRAAAGAVASASLSGVLHTVSLTHTEIPTNRSQTPRHLMHELGRHGDWNVPGRVDFFVSCRGSSCDPSGKGGSEEDTALGAEGEPVVVVAAGGGLWAAVSSQGSALVCVAPCLRLSRLTSPDASSTIASVAVGRLSLFVTTARGDLYAAVSTWPVDRISPEAAAAAESGAKAAGAAPLYPAPAESGAKAAGAATADGATTAAAAPSGAPPHGRRVEVRVEVPRLGSLQRLHGSLSGRRVLHVAASASVAVAVTRDGQLHAWRVGPEQQPEPPSAHSSDGGRCSSTSAISRQPRLLAAADAVRSAPPPADGRRGVVGAAVSSSHLLALTADGRVLSAALPPRHRGAALELAALGRPAGGVHAAADVLAPVLAPSLQRKHANRKHAPLPRISAIAAGRSFSLALTAWGYARGELLYWGGPPPPPHQPSGEWASRATGSARRRLSQQRPKRPGPLSDRPATFQSWCGIKDRFLLISAYESRAVALSTSGVVFWWTHDVDRRPRRLEPTSPPAISAVAAGEAVALLLVPSFDLRIPPQRRAHVLAQPAPLPRPLVVATDNIGVAEAASAMRGAAHATRDGVALGRRVRTPCWLRGARAATCPLRRKGDCSEWLALDRRPQTKSAAPPTTSNSAPPTTSSAAPPTTSTSDHEHLRTSAAPVAARRNEAEAATPPSTAATRCLPAALLLAARGCSGVAPLWRALSSHPEIVGGPTRMRPWWSYRSLDNLTEAPQMRDAVTAILDGHTAPTTALDGHTAPTTTLESSIGGRLLLQRAPLDARSLGLLHHTSLRDARVSLADLLPRVQPDLRVLLYVCEPRRRLLRLQKHATRRQQRLTRLAEQQASFESCASREPLSECAAHLHSAAPLAEGIYSLWVRALMRALPASQLRVLRAEDFLRDPEGAAREVFKFLQVKADAPSERLAKSEAESAQEEGTTTEPTTTEPALAKETEGLADFYDGHAVELVQLMDGDERFAWPR